MSTYKITWCNYNNRNKTESPVFLHADSKQEAIKKFPYVIPFAIIQSIEQINGNSEICQVEFEEHYDHYLDAFNHMIAQGVKHVGWLNSGITPPEGDYRRVYSNWSGSSCLYCDPIKRIAYSVDMGD